MILISIDPGDHAGQARFVEGELLQATNDPRNRGDRVTPDIVVIECPYIYPQRHSKANPNDMITLAIKVGELKNYWSAAMPVLPKPREWNGGATKKWTEERVWKALDEKERGILREALRKVAPSRRHNLIDAVAIGLWYLTSHTKLR